MNTATYTRVGTRRSPLLLLGITASLFTASFLLRQPPQPSRAAAPLGADGPAYDVVFVSRPIADYGSFYVRDSANFPGVGLAMPKDMPGVGARSRFRVSRGGKLLVRKQDGTVVTLLDGSNPGQTPFNLIDFNAPDVSYDGTKLVFAAAPDGTYEDLRYNPDYPTRNGHAKEPGVWRLFVMNVDGTGLRQLTFTQNPALDLSQFSGKYGTNVEFGQADDTDPAWLPDGRVVFSSTRFPVKAEYTGVRATHLYVVNADGTNPHRITTERNSADRPAVDPLTGRIVYARWWRNFHFPRHSMGTEAYTEGGPITDGYDSKDGVTGNRNKTAGEQEGILPIDNLFRNSWQMQSVNPDGTDLRLFAGFQREEPQNHAYGLAFADDGTAYANFFPMFNMTEAAGFGGIRRYPRGLGKPTGVLGVTEVRSDPAQFVIPQSYGMYPSDYASEPSVLPDGNLLVSYLPDTPRRIFQDYGLYHFNPQTRALTLLYDAPDRAELRAKAIRPRPVPPVIADRITNVPSLLPPKGTSDIAKDGTFTFDAVNVYFNAPVDADLVSAPKVGEAASLRFYAMPQRINPGSFSQIDWPLFLNELTVNAYGAVKSTSAPANVQLFEQLRTAKTAGYKVPFTGGPDPDGAGHVTGLNYGRPGETVRCVGCHAGHSTLTVPSSNDDIIFTNLAPGATVAVSSVLSSQQPFIGSVIDRKVLKTEEPYQIWTSESGKQTNQWVKLTFPQNVWVKKVKLYDPKADNSVAVAVTKATVKLYADAAATQLKATQVINQPLTTAGVEVAFSKVKTRVVRVEINAGSGHLFHHQIVGLGEIEVVASAGDPATYRPLREAVVDEGPELAAQPTAIQAFPNPTTDEVRIQLPVNQPADVELYDLTGRMTFGLKQATTPDGELRLSTRHLPEGLYVLRVRTDGRVVAQKIKVAR